MATFHAPAEFQAELEAVPVQDNRTDEEILSALAQHVPVTSEKNVWACWHSGVSAMPSWCQRNVIAWVRMCGSGWTIRVLDVVPGSPNHALKFAPPEMLPDAFVNGTMSGPYTGPHSADFLRGALLYTHGGISMDVGCILIRDLDRLCWNIIQDPTSPYDIVVPLMYAQSMANHFVAAKKGNPFIKRWHDLFTHMWKGRTDGQGILQDPLFAFITNGNFQKSEAQGFVWDFKVSPQTLKEYIAQVLCWTRLCMLEDAGDGFSSSDYWQKHIYCFDVLQESWGAESIIGFVGSGQKLCALLSLRLDSDPEEPEYKEAYRIVWRILTKSSVQKVVHAKNFTLSTHLGVLWDQNPGKDCEPGTFGELLRYGSLHFRQTRASIVQMEAKKADKTMKKGLLEA